ncbi:MAG: hypothetical protein AAGU05_14740, partial [Anaerolineaceae bacterium]
MNEEFVEFPTSNDEGKQPDDEHDPFLSGFSDDDETLDFSSLIDPSMTEEVLPEETAAEAFTSPVEPPDAEETALNQEWSLTPEQTDEPQPDPADDTAILGGFSGEWEDDAGNPRTFTDQAPGQPFEMDIWLADQQRDGNYHALLILKSSQTWKYAGELTGDDLREVERIIAESKNTRAIDMARYARLGAAQQKYLLYTTSISGSLVLCSVNYAYRQLSEIRS